ncbi:MAG: hypothetical protein PHC83_05590 [Bacteroidales bacterium]|nr:hypothetical protein [Bacteroidales bacterium]MDD4210477.1 hypothetical protein [Bacteroidales bacterium]
MKKKILILIACLFAVFTYTLTAQTPQEESVEFNKKMVNAVSLEIPDLDVATVTSAMEKFMENNGLKKTGMKGFNAYLNQPFAKLSTQNLDMYTTVISKGKKKNAKTYVYFLLSKGNENFVSSQENASEIMNVKTLLLEFLEFTGQYALEQKIACINDNITQLEKEKSKIEKSGEKIEKKKDKIDKDMKKNEDELKKKNEEISKAKTQLEQLKSQSKK